MRVAVVVATLGRPEEVGQLLRALIDQTTPPHRVVLSVVDRGDAPADLPAGVDIVIGEKGLPRQRNLGLEQVTADSDLVAFFDDDYLPSRFALERIVGFFEAWPDVAGANGILLADGVNSAGVEADEALAMIAAHDATSTFDPGIDEPLPNGLYGCNMVYRTSAIGDVRFDETLPLYGWQEDLDFSVQVGRRGRLVRAKAFVGVHRGVKGGRTSGVRLGYSQVANPVYLARKGTMRWGYALPLILRNLAANHLKVLRPEPWVDRAGRLKGNWRALADLAAGRADPMKVLTF